MRFPLTGSERLDKLVGGKHHNRIWVVIRQQCHHCCGHLDITTDGENRYEPTRKQRKCSLPFQGPILGATFGYRIADYAFARASLINECIMATTGFAIGLIFGLIFGPESRYFNWPTVDMELRGTVQNLIFTAISSSAAGAVLGVSITGGGINSMVGVALSASLLVPIIDAGMLCIYSLMYSTTDNYPTLRNMAGVAFAVRHTNRIDRIDFVQLNCCVIENL